MAAIYSDRPTAIDLQQRQRPTRSDQATATDVQHKPAATDPRRPAHNDQSTATELLVRPKASIRRWDLPSSGKMYIRPSSTLPDAEAGPREPEILGKHQGNFVKAEVWVEQKKEKGPGRCQSQIRRSEPGEREGQRRIWRMEVQVLFFSSDRWFCSCCTCTYIPAQPVL